MEIEQLNTQLAKNRKAQTLVGSGRNEHQGQTRAFTDKISEAAGNVTIAHKIFTDDPSSANKAKLDSARESVRKLTRAKADHLQAAPDEESIKVDMTALQLAERQILTKLRSHKLVVLKEEYNLLMEDMSVNLPRAIALGYHLSSLLPGNTDPFIHLRVVMPNLISMLDAEWLKIKEALDGRS